MIFKSCPLCNEELHYEEYLTSEPHFICNNKLCMIKNQWRWMQHADDSFVWQLIVTANNVTYKLNGDLDYHVGKSIINYRIYIFVWNKIKCAWIFESDTHHSNNFTDTSNFLQLCKNEIRKIRLKVFK